MWFDVASEAESPRAQRRIARLQQAHRERYGTVLAVLIGGGFAAIPLWVYFTR